MPDKRWQPQPPKCGRILLFWSALMTCSMISWFGFYKYTEQANIRTVIIEDVDATDVRVLKQFLGSTPRTVIRTARPSYFPNLKSACFYDKTESTQVPSRASFKLRCLPRIFLVGFCKSGTTDIHYYITSHRQIYSPVVKEPHFFDQHGPNLKRNKWTVRTYTEYFQPVTSFIQNCCLSPHVLNDPSRVACKVDTENTTDWKVNLPEWKRRISSINEKLLIQRIEDKLIKDKAQLMNSTNCPIFMIDSTPNYVWSNHQTTFRSKHGEETKKVSIPEKIKHVIPDAKIIIIMRRPEDRLWSDYNYFPYKFNKSADHFHDYVVKGMNWWNACVNRHSIQHCASGNEYKKNSSLAGLGADIGGLVRLRISIYYPYVVRWLSVFDRENMLFIRFEDYVNNPASYVNQHVFKFLGLDGMGQSEIQNITKLTPSKQVNKRISMHERTRSMLREFYQPYNKMLSKQLNDDSYLWLD